MLDNNSIIEYKFENLLDSYIILIQLEQNYGFLSSDHKMLLPIKGTEINIHRDKVKSIREGLSEFLSNSTINYKLNDKFAIIGEDYMDVIITEYKRYLINTYKSNFILRPDFTLRNFNTKINNVLLEVLTLNMGQDYYENVNIYNDFISSNSGEQQQIIFENEHEKIKYNYKIIKKMIMEASPPPSPSPVTVATTVNLQQHLTFKDKLELLYMYLSNCKFKCKIWLLRHKKIKILVQLAFLILFVYIIIFMLK
jgi:hypothetical protein